MRILKANVENFVPDAVKRDLRRQVSRLKDKGASQLCIMVPLADFDPMQREISGRCFCPYVPVLFDIPVCPWDKAYVALLARPHRASMVVFMLDGTEYDLSHVIDTNRPTSEQQAGEDARKE